MITNSSDQRYQELVSKLRKQGSRITSLRLALIRLITTLEGHPNVTELYERLRVQFPTASLATVYKTLALLRDEGEVLEINLRDDSHYDGLKPFAHPHLICNRCSRIFDGDDVLQFQHLEQEIGERYRFKITRHQLVFYGLCRDCQGSN